MKETIWPEAEYNKHTQGFKTAVDSDECCVECNHLDADVFFEGDMHINAICDLGKFRCFFNTVCKKFKRKEDERWLEEILEPEKEK